MVAVVVAAAEVEAAFAAFVLAAFFLFKNAVNFDTFLGGAAGAGLALLAGTAGIFFSTAAFVAAAAAAVSLTFDSSSNFFRSFSCC